MSNARQQQPLDGNEADEIQLPARRRDPYVLMPTHGPRHGLALPTAPTHAVAGPSRGAQVIDLTEDDDDDIEITGEAAPVRPADDGARFIGRPAAHEPRRVIRAQRPDFRYIPRPREEAAPYDVNAWRDLNGKSAVLAHRIELTNRIESSCGISWQSCSSINTGSRPG